MAKTIVINGADFSANHLDVVNLNGDSRPCTGVTISDPEISLSQIGSTHQVNYSVTPVDTTNARVWTSSNNAVATVTNGVVTAVGVGDATITLKCGRFSASVSVVVIPVFSASWTVGSQVISDTVTDGSGKRFINVKTLVSAMYAYASDGTYPYYGVNTAFPVPIPSGVSKIRVTANGYYIGIVWSNSNVSEYSDVAVGLGGNIASSSAGIADDHTYDVPSGANCFTLTIRKKVSSAIDISEVSNVHVEYISE